MKDLTSQDTQTLIGKIKSFLGITWVDIDTDNEINDFILSSIRFIDDTAGVELDYLITPASETNDLLFNTMSYLGQELLKNRVFYFREKALDDFKTNYKGELLTLFLDGKVMKDRKNVEQ